MNRYIKWRLSLVAVIISLLFSGAINAKNDKVAPSFFIIRDNLEKMTEIQFDNYVKEIEGAYVKWSGYVYDVEKGFFSGYSLVVDMDGPDDPLSLPEIYIDIEESIAPQIIKKKRIDFDGTIKRISTPLGVLHIEIEKEAIYKQD